MTSTIPTSASAPASASASAPASTPAPRTAPAVGGVQTVRRVVTYILLIIMVTTAANGVSGLIDRWFITDPDQLYYSSYGLAESLAFTFFAGPLAALLWWFAWRKESNARDRGSVAWPVYLVIMSTAALLTFTVSLFTWAGDAIKGNVQPYGVGAAIAWGLVWLWHYWMWRHPRKGPTRLLGVAPAIASLIGLSFGVGGLIFAISSLIDSAVGVSSDTVVAGYLVWQVAASSLVWALGGGLLWWWHWFRVGVRSQHTGFSNVLLVYISGAASYAVVAFGIISTLSVALNLVTGSPDPIDVTLDPLGIGLASAAVGALVLVYHSRVIVRRSDEMRSAHRLVSAGVSLSVAATGVGMTVNALLGALGERVTGNNIHSLLMTGISTLIVGGTLWWVTWRPRQASTPERAATTGRRIYLVVIFGLSALVALITLLVIGFQLFTFILDGSGGGSFVERSRQAIGLLTATVLVAAYHFAIWKKDRAAAVAHERVRRIDRVTLVTAGDGSSLAAAVRAATGARVTVLRRAHAAADADDPDDPDAAAGDAAAGESTTADLTTGAADDVAGVQAGALVRALDGIETSHVLVVVGAKANIEVIQLVN